VLTLFGLLFFDIIFASIPGAFETPYQSAPLDIAEDTFYDARRDLIEARLLEIEAGTAKDIVERVDAEHREKGTWCVGVRWDLFERQDLMEIVQVGVQISVRTYFSHIVTQCFDGKALAAICRLLCEDYAARGSGVPDLFIWDVKLGVCKFVEVKGPGDSLQENQKVRLSKLF
jgi:fanconi-associated nuclease 1